MNYISRAKEFKAKKTFGQNFLISNDVIDFIADFAKNGDNILEIGPGLGFVTEKLVKRAKNVTAVELDKSACNILEKNLGGEQNFKLVQNDILKTNIASLFSSNEKIKIIGNIPYYITTPILLYLLGEIDDRTHNVRNITSEILLMVQEEVAKRITADNNSKNKEYGMLSILSNFWAETSIVKLVSRKCFYPGPKVNSALVHFKIKNKPQVEITPNLRRTIKAAFSMRRKNIKNCFKAAGFINADEALKNCGIEQNRRGENLSIDDFYKLSLALKGDNL